MWKGIKKSFGTIVGVYLGLGAVYCINSTLKDILNEIKEKNGSDKTETNKEESVEEGEAQ